MRREFKRSLRNGYSLLPRKFWMPILTTTQTWKIVRMKKTKIVLIVTASLRCRIKWTIVKNTSISSYTRLSIFNQHLSTLNLARKWRCRHNTSRNTMSNDLFLSLTSNLWLISHFSILNKKDIDSAHPLQLNVYKYE
jgi:hypothetical protein